jgi:7,8-dihydropterin-6-yl-methyl-4-(beta-D-ribofuranosyl)aminobenzene 5'-phosphate synthase
MEIKITTLSENTANHGFIAEWGLSILIEIDGTRILMDTGWGFSAAYNAQLLGIDLDTIDTIIISHGHRDHTGGLRDILRRRRNPVNVVAHPDIWASKYTHLSARDEFSGIPFSRESLESAGARFNLSKEPLRLSDNVMTSGEIPMVSGYEIIEDNLLVRHGDSLQPDPLADDLALIIKTDYGLIVVLGCAHHGMVNTLRHAQKLADQELIYGVIGGTHLYRASIERINATISELKDIGIQKLGVSHCTGFRASARLAQEFEEIFFMNNAGTSLTLP